ncbi:MAG TPA: carboxypeptidase-like regulatory domain-containing protein [Longimicrobium sp.]|jgi:hypothetical protein
MRPIPFPRILALLALLVAARPLAAQTVQGELVDAAGKPLPGAMVVLLDAAGKSLGRVLTDESGRFVLRAPSAGSYRLRAERIGYGGTESPPLQLAEGEARSYRLEGGGRAVVLDAVVAQGGRRRCEVRPGEGTAAAAVWNEVRKALDAAAYLQERRALRFRTDEYTRDLEPGSLRVTAEQRKTGSTVGAHPFRSLSAEELSRGGYVQTSEAGTFYHAPDAQSLLSDAFLDGHCFHVQQGTGEAAGLVGLAFEPVGGQRLPDVAGVLWVEPSTRELLRLEYRYTNLDVTVPTEQLGGRVDFDRSPGGGWIVRRWWVRMPALAVDQQVRSAQSSSGVEVSRRARLVGIREVGGEVTAVLGADGAPLRAEPRRGALAGRVADHEGAPLPGARVFLSGTSFEAVADSAGSFRIEGVPAGEYTVSFTHPRLETLGTIPPQQRVTLADGGPPPADVALATPAPPPAVAAAAPRRPANGETPVALPGVTARAAYSHGGFYQRARGSVGTFITRADIARRHATETTELLRSVPALEVTPEGVRLRGRAQQLVTDPGTMKAVLAAPSQESGGDPTSMPDCLPGIVIDGQPHDPAINLNFIPPGEIEGIEVYGRDALAPLQFRQRNSCGLIIVWTRDGAPRRPAGQAPRAAPEPADSTGARRAP